jgi:hypothetical protein
MTFNRRLGLLLPLIALLPAAVRAGATDRAGFFDIGKRPTVAFDKKTLTWTLRNQVVERVVHFAAASGSLSTPLLRDLRRHRDVAQAPGGECWLSFATRLLDTPQPLPPGWKAAPAPPDPAAWSRPDFDDRAWTPVDGPGSSAPVAWYRYKLPAGLVPRGHSFAFVIGPSPSARIEVYVDGTTAEGPEADLSATSSVIAIKVENGHGPIFAGVAEQGSAPPALDLKSDWKYNLYSVNAGDDGSQILTVSLSGLRRYEGFDLDVSYQIYAGNEPFLAKWVQFTNHRRSRFLLEQAVLDRWTVSDATTLNPNGQVAVSESTAQDGLVTALLSDLGRAEEDRAGHTVAAALRPNYPIETDRVQLTPRSVLALFHGPAAAGCFLYQLYLAQYVVRTSATGIPTAYSTESFGNSITESICSGLIPRVAALGAKVLLLYDGWQANTRPDAGAYGDWIVDHARFPAGLVGISTALREAGLRLGLWMDPVRADRDSDAASAHPEWLWQPAETGANGLPRPQEMCFATSWGPSLAESMAVLCRELSVIYLRTGGDFEREGCMAKEHSHPVAFSMAEQIDGWTDFCDRLRKVDRAFVLCADLDSPSLLSQHDVEHAAGIPGAAGTLPNDNASWIRLAEDQPAILRPPFALVGRAPCHLPTLDTDALEYCLTGALGRSANLELVGDATQMTAAEGAAVQKWVAWRQESLPWLAYAQAPAVTQGTARAVLHLRDVHEGRYGYLFVWQGAEAGASRIEFRPEDFAIRMMPESLAIVSIKDRAPANFSSREGTITIDLELPAHGWQVYELKLKSTR